MANLALSLLFYQVRYFLQSMVIELLKVEVSPEYRTQYLQLDKEIWTQALAKFPGFLGKEVWLNPNQPSEVILLVRWASYKEWKSISVQLLEEIERQFEQATGNICHQIVESLEYEVISQ